MLKNITEEANKLYKSAPYFKGGIVMGLQLVRDSLQLTDKQIGEINKAIDIVAGVQKYIKPAPRPAEINRIEDAENEAVIAAKSEANKLPRRDDTEKLKETPGEPKRPEKIDTPKRPDKIRRPWEKDPNTIRRPKR